VKDSAPFVSYAQHGEDVVLWRALGDTRDGVYVDVGAYDPNADSVTRAFYERGWRGVNIEPQPDRVSAFNRERPDETNIWAAVSSAEGTATLVVPPNAGWASIKSGVTKQYEDAQTIDVPQRTLAALLREHGITKIDFLKIDVEGAEADVVRGLDLDAIRPRVVVVEGVAPVIGRTAGDEAVRLLQDAGYRHCMFDGLNHYLTHDESLVNALSVPANPLDNYVPALYGDLLADREQLIETIERLVAERGTRTERSHHPSGPARRAQAERSPWKDSSESPRVDIDKPGESLEGAFAPHPDRSGRRRQLFMRHLRGRLVFHIPTIGSAAAAERTSLLHALSAQEPEEIVEGLYRAILRRPSDASGQATWADRIAGGFGADALALVLLASAEARDLGVIHQMRIESDLQQWAATRALAELGVRVDGFTPRTSGTAADEIFVEALYQTVLRRLPTPAELAFEVAKLRAGVGREWMIRAFARRPEAAGVLLDVRGRQLHARAVRWFRRRWLLSARVRDLVLAAESREISRLMARVSRTAVGTNHAEGLPRQTGVG
jgi:FkbM family methyltransferase